MHTHATHEASGSEAQARTDALVREHLPWARSVARRAQRILPPSVSIDDLAAVAAVALWQCAQKYRPDFQEPGYGQPVAFRAYARPKVYFACLMAFRRRNYREATHERIPAECVDHTQDLDRRARVNEVSRLVRATMRNLPPRQATLIEAYYLKQRSLTDMAKHFGMSGPWAVWQHRQALATLRAGLEELGIRRVADCL